MISSEELQIINSAQQIDTTVVSLSKVKEGAFKLFIRAIPSCKNTKRKLAKRVGKWLADKSQRLAKQFIKEYMAKFIERLQNKGTTVKLIIGFLLKRTL